MGGLDNKARKATASTPTQAATYAPTPEVYSPTLGLRALTNALSDEAYGGSAGSWNYPRVWLAPNGHVFVLAHSVTHAFNNEQRLLELSFTQSGTSIQLHTPADRAVAPPGFYLLFVFDAAGVPSVARVVKLNA